MPLIETNDLCQRYDGRHILRNINLSIEAGEVLALIGPTGAGKTTLLRLLALLDTPTSGAIFFDGANVAGSPRFRLEMRRRMAFVLQKPMAFNASVYDNVASGLRWRGLGRAEVRDQVERVLEMIGLSADRNRNARTLSGGEMQRVAIARAIALDPEVLLLDEPTANLDPVSARRTEELLAAVIRQRSATVILSTHDLAQGQRLADRIGVLINGEIPQIGTSRDIFVSPGSREVAEFVGVENILDGTVLSSAEDVVTVDIGGGLIEAVSDVAVGQRVSVCVRPENVTLALSRLSSSARNSFTGKVTWLSSAGPLARVHVDCGFPLVALVTRRSAADLDLHIGRQVYVTFKASATHVIRTERDS
ncbi:MAG: ABC transporter ATP-binding protein [Chloroflexi bacterium]|nr:ABC transporter ATP-binding protein [Chloroflexota bacterium]